MQWAPSWVSLTYNLGFFLGPGLPRILGSMPFAPAALRFTPFFLEPSAGGPMEAGAGVLGFDSEALSPFDTAAGASVEGRAAGAAGDSLESLAAGDSSLTEAESMIFRRLSGDTLSTTSEDLPPDLRLSLSLAGVDMLGTADGIDTSKDGCEGDGGGWWTATGWMGGKGKVAAGVW